VDEITCHSDRFVVDARLAVALLMVDRQGYSMATGASEGC
jgi:hypothetical protein